jgi:hypothetical protein
MNNEEFQSLINQINLAKEVGENLRKHYEKDQEKLVEDRRASMRAEKLEEVDRLILSLDLPKKSAKRS